MSFFSYLDNNKLLANVSLSNDQAQFVFNLQNFTIDTASLLTGCDKAAQLKLHNYTFCIAGGVVKPTATQTPKPAATTRLRAKAAAAAPFKPGLKRVHSLQVSTKSAPNEQATSVETPTSSSSASVVSVQAASIASESSSRSEDPVALAVTGAVGGAVVVLVAMGAIWLVTKAVSRKQSQPVGGAV